MTITLDTNDIDQDILLFCAFRYALGRRTYVVSTIAKIIIYNWDKIDIFRQEMFKKEIQEAIDKGFAGSRWDVEEWEKILRLPMNSDFDNRANNIIHSDEIHTGGHSDDDLGCPTREDRLE